MYYARPKNDYLPWDKVVQNRFKPVQNWFKPVQNWFSDFWPIQNQNQNQMAGGEPEPEPNQNRGLVQLVLVLWTGSEPNFGIPISHARRRIFRIKFKRRTEVFGIWLSKMSKILCWQDEAEMPERAGVSNRDVVTKWSSPVGILAMARRRVERVSVARNGRSHVIYVSNLRNAQLHYYTGRLISPAQQRNKKTDFHGVKHNSWVSSDSHVNECGDYKLEEHQKGEV
ncbi:hypothetical protein BYT27DRAFT_7238194 [Phlegmacium glaucopus]|nr:hypothetical protein BYT27DRAFT_7238194 [Phlegmacium glaucopus]